MTILPDLSGPIGRLRSACIGDLRSFLDLRRNAVLWLSTCAGLPPQISSFYVDIGSAPSDLASYDSQQALASLGYLLGVGGSPPLDRLILHRALDQILSRASHTVERTGYADDPLVLTGLALLANWLPNQTAHDSLVTIAQSRSGMIPITLALPLVTAAGVRPRLTSIDDTSMSQMAAITLASFIPEARAADLLPATTLLAAPERLVQAAALDRLSYSSDFDNLLVLAALEVIVGAVGRPHPPKITAPRLAGTTDLVFVVALREEFRVLFEEVGRPKPEELGSRIYYGFNQNGNSCKATLIGEMGTEAALMATTQAIEHWKPQAVVFLGIAGGIHSDVQIGDVVVASQIDLFMTGAKATDGDAGLELQHAGRAFHVDYNLIQRVRNLEFTVPDEFSRWQEESRQFLISKLPRVEGLGGVRVPPILVDGHIASGPLVATSNRFSQWLKARDRKYIAVEMEGGGAAMASANRSIPVPVLIIRGISDHADADKTTSDAIGDGGLRLYAMRNAVKFALDVLLSAKIFQS